MSLCKEWSEDDFQLELYRMEFRFAFCIDKNVSRNITEDINF